MPGMGISLVFVFPRNNNAFIASLGFPEHSAILAGQRQLVTCVEHALDFGRRNLLVHGRDTRDAADARDGRDEHKAQHGERAHGH